ncbi:MAG: hypothetical protein U5L96_02980 [Owenweeksia sp.]|nr:hypothetical protein [Owenweeksia sp.]
MRARFRVVSNGCCAGDNSLDDINFIAGPSCPVPTNLNTRNLSDVQATAAWTAGTSANSYQVWYGPQGFYQGTQTTIGGTRVITEQRQSADYGADATNLL